jgi:putative restriction endonuclease
LAGIYVGITDRGWYEHLATMPYVDEVNFWRPSPRSRFLSLEPGELFVFKLHHPDNAIVGGGVYTYFTRLPVGIAWDAFEEKNGAATRAEMLNRLARYRPELRTASLAERLNSEIGCIILGRPFFLRPDKWIAIRDWHPNIVQGKTYDLETADGVDLLEEVRARLVDHAQLELGEEAGRFGKPLVIQPRLGQGTFRVLVTDAYHRRCSMTGERVLPVLQAAHIRPYAEGGRHLVANGVLLRSDLHTLFDRGYLTIRPDFQIEVSSRLKQDFQNGEEYLGLQGSSIFLPDSPGDRPDPELLTWHGDTRFVA